jgi:DNA-binding LytR/AlgR family response regulator
MTYRRDLMNPRVIVRHSDSDATSEGPPRRFAAASAVALAMPAQHGGPQGHASVPVRSTALADSGGSRDVILVKTALKQVAVRLSEVTFVEAARNYVRIHLDTGTVLKSRVPISRLARHLGPDRFLRIHRGRLVNIDRVRTVTNLAGGRLALQLNDGSRIIVARDRRRVVLQELGRTAAPLPATL